MAAPVFRVPGPAKICFSSDGLVPTVEADSLGETKSGILITIQTHLVPVMADEYGSAPADYLFTGKSALVECIGLDPAKIKAVKYYRDFLGELGTTETVGALYSNLSDKPYQLLIQENYRGAEVATDYQWVAKCVFPVVDSDLNYRSSAEFAQSLKFRILPDTDGLLFSTIPTYLVGAGA